MRPPLEAASWFGPPLPDPGSEPIDHPQEFERLWRGFMTARVTLGLVLLLLQSALYIITSSKDTPLILICIGYFAAALTTRLMAKPRAPGKTFNMQLISTLCIDIVAFAALQLAQGTSINYAPLFALPVLMAAVLGSLLLALASAAAVALWLLAYASWMSLQPASDPASHFLQAALTGAGCFVISVLANQTATRLANVELRAQRNQLAARVQRRVNELVIETLTEGVLVVDARAIVRAANPAARELLGAEHALRDGSFDLASLNGWRGLVDQMTRCFGGQAGTPAEVTIHHAGQGPRRVRVRTQLTATPGGSEESLCVMFLQDQREMEARMRTEKLASMGRMSAAVAHEIRNPLAAIAQANALLEEDLSEPRHRQLTQMVQQNTRRLEKIVEEILNISRVQHRAHTLSTNTLVLGATVERYCRDWHAQLPDQRAPTPSLHLPSRRIEVHFESEHLRRILINLLDNARRHASTRPDAVQVTVGLTPAGQGQLSVWSDGPAMDQSVERHLFEPFFSSESRSSGLGLYICRELCEQHGASIVYDRTPRVVEGSLVDGNAFTVSFRTLRAQGGIQPAQEQTTTTPWLPTQH